ncbi:MAG: hypothetical protein O2960_05515 [Verrucomicrobia bacterium]|nr:hypothetical protein [Verrucomicrobiota bacterium]
MRSSLAMGIWTSSRSTNDQKAIWTSAVLLGLITGFPFLFDYILNFGNFQVASGLLAFGSPVYGFLLAQEAAYLPSPESFWITLITVHGAAWLFLFSACRRIARVRQDDADAGETSLWNRWDRWSRGTRTAEGERRKSLLDVNPILWMKNRSRRDRAWALALIWKAAFVAGVFISTAGTSMQMPLTASGSVKIEFPVYMLATTVLDFVSFATNLFALSWVGMWFGLSGRKPSHAATVTFIVVIIVPSFLE